MYYKTLAKVWPKPKKFTLHIGASTAFERPQLSIIVAGIIALSADIENIKAQMMVGLLKGEPKVSVPMFMSLRSLKDSALKTAAEANLPRPQSKLFLKALKCTGKFETERNYFAHWPWAHCLELPDHFCLVDPTSAPSAQASIQQIALLAQKAPVDPEYSRKKMQKHGDKMRTQTRAYDKDNLSDIANLGRASKALLQELSWCLNFPDEAREAQFAQLEARILSFPERGKGSSQSTQANS